MEFGSKSLYSRTKIRSGFFQQITQQLRIKAIIDTTCYLCDLKQSFLVQSVEHLFLPNSSSFNDKVKEECCSFLKKYSLPSTCHSLLFVGTKQLVQFDKPKAFNLEQHDIFLLILFFFRVFTNMR